MVIVKSYLGEISISRNFFSRLIGETLTKCFGVADTNTGGFKQAIMESLPLVRKNKYPDKGVSVRSEGGKLVVNLHISIIYGVNMSSIVRSIQHKIAYVINEETGLEVNAVNVFIDGIKN